MESLHIAHTHICSKQEDTAISFTEQQNKHMNAMAYNTRAAPSSPAPFGRASTNQPHEATSTLRANLPVFHQHQTAQLLGRRPEAAIEQQTAGRQRVRLLSSLTGRRRTAGSDRRPALSRVRALEQKRPRPARPSTRPNF